MKMEKQGSCHSQLDDQDSTVGIECQIVASRSKLEIKPNDKRNEFKEEELSCELWSQLPNALVDKVFARLSFHALFRIQVLSRKWAARITQCLAFQDELTNISAKWESFCPLFWSWSCEWLVGYNRTAQHWQKLFSTSYFSGINKVRWLSSGAGGSLLCFHQGGWSGGDLNLHVTNPLLKTWNKLPMPTTPSRPMLDIVHVVRVGVTSYKVIVITQDDRTSIVDEMFPFDSPKSNLCAEIYSPVLNKWSIDGPGPLVSRGTRKVSSTYFEGTLYFALATSGFKSFKNLTLFAYEVERGVWATIAHPFEIEDDICQCGIVVCQSKVLLVVMQSKDRPVRGFKLGVSVYGPSFIPKCSIQILLL